MSTNECPTQDKTVLRGIIHSLLHLVEKPKPIDQEERRASPRYEVNWSAMIRFDDDPVWMPIYIRDISEIGVGFRHEVPMRQGYATISFFTAKDRPTVQLRMRLLWCEPTENDMYISGSEFVSVADDVPSPW